MNIIEKYRELTDETINNYMDIISNAYKPFNINTFNIHEYSMNNHI